MAVTEKLRSIKPQKGFQENFLASSADIVIGGGSAGGGKTFALLMDPLRYIDNPDFGAVIFRRTTPQIRNEGGLWDTSELLYPLIGGESRQTNLEWVFRRGARVKMAHLEYDKDVLNYQGAQIPYIGFDELTHFSEKQFWYMLSRNRSGSGVRPCIRAGCNPDPDSWVAKLLEWWIDQETGFPIPERNGLLRYFVKDGDHMVWGDSVKEVIDKCPHIFGREELKGRDHSDLVKSITFIRGDVFENKELLEKDPSYLANLLSLDDELKARLLDGNWKVRSDGLSLFDYIKLQDLFSNFVPTGSRYITCDVARFGRDLCVIKLWEGFRVVKIRILTKSKTTDVVQEIEKLRELGKVSKSDVLVDQDGIGGGVVDEGGYCGFSGGLPALEDPATKIKENYANLKTQCTYRIAERVNRGEVSVSLDDVIVDGVPSNRVNVGSKTYAVEDLIRDDLRSFKRKDPDAEGKKKMSTKEEQKNALGGRSPDCGDTFIMREWFELRKKSSFYGAIV